MEIYFYNINKTTITTTKMILKSKQEQVGRVGRQNSYKSNLTVKWLAGRLTLVSKILRSQLMPLKKNPNTQLLQQL